MLSLSATRRIVVKRRRQQVGPNRAGDAERLSYVPAASHPADCGEGTIPATVGGMTIIGETYRSVTVGDEWPA